MYDANAVAVVESIGRTVQRLHPDRQGGDHRHPQRHRVPHRRGPGRPRRTSHLTDALVAMAAIVRLDARAVTLITRKLDKLSDRIG